MDKKEEYKFGNLTPILYIQKKPFLILGVL